MHVFAEEPEKSLAQLGPEQVIPEVQQALQDRVYALEDRHLEEDEQQRKLRIGQLATLAEAMRSAEAQARKIEERYTRD